MSVNLNKIAADMIVDCEFWNHADCPFSVHLSEGEPRLMLVAGDNASGKSLFVEFLRSWAKNFHKVEATISLSIRERTGAGLSDMSGMRKSMIFGDESKQSTGATSVKVTGNGLHNLDAWSADGKNIVMVLDEPEMGLSQSYCVPLGQMIARRLKAIDRPQAAAVVVTHNRGLAKAMADEWGSAPSFVHLGGPLTFEQWLEDSPAHSVENLEALTEVGHLRRRAVYAIEKALTAESK